MNAHIRFINGTDINMYYESATGYKRTNTPMSIVRDAYNQFEFVISKSNVTFFCNGASVAVASTTQEFKHSPFGTLSSIGVTGITNDSTGTSTVDISEIAVLPSESYADDFSTDTVSRTALAAFSTPSGSVEVANEYVSRYTGV